MRLIPLLLLVACGGDPLVVTPTNIQWGEVDFQEDMPVDGYDAQQVILQNTGNKELQFRVTGFDESHLQLGAIWQDAGSYTLLPTAGGSSNVLSVGVIDYELGELTTEVSGSFSITADGLRDPVVVSWAFTPVRKFSGDTGTD